MLLWIVWLFVCFTTADVTVRRPETGVALRIHVNGYAPFHTSASVLADATESIGRLLTNLNVDERRQHDVCVGCQLWITDLDGNTDAPVADEPDPLLDDFFTVTVVDCQCPGHVNEAAFARRILLKRLIELRSAGLSLEVVGVEQDTVVAAASPGPSSDVDVDVAAEVEDETDVGVWRRLMAARGSDVSDDDSGDVAAAVRLVQRGARTSPVDALHAEALWHRYPQSQGQGVRIGICDTGLSEKNPHMARSQVARCMSFTDEKDEATSRRWCSDGHGHGTFAASLIAGTAAEAEANVRNGCRQFDVADGADRVQFPASRFGGGVGLAPKASLFIFKVFTDEQMSLTSWFLRAFNAAIQLHLDIINFSFGGMDYYDSAFVEKIRELTRAGVVVITATGNDGPRHGTVYNPADQPEALAVGSCDGPVPTRVSPFSSRGMTTWEIPYGVGRPRPDVVSFGENILGGSSLRIRRSCRVLSGTSMASPVVAGALAMLLSFLRDTDGEHLQAGARLNQSEVIPAVLLKQILMATADGLEPQNKKRIYGDLGPAVHALRESSVYTQGAGAVNLTRAFQWVETMRRSRLLELTAHPPVLLAIHDVAARKHLREPLAGVPWYCFQRCGVSTAEIRTAGNATSSSASKCGCDFPQRWVAQYAWPHVQRVLFYGSSPTIWNVTLYHAARPPGGKPHSRLSRKVMFQGATALVWDSPERKHCATVVLSAEAAASLLSVDVQLSEALSATGSGFASVAMYASQRLPRDVVAVRVFGHCEWVYKSSATAAASAIVSRVRVPFVVDIAPQPPREKRLLWDFTNQLSFPAAYVPRDNVREAFSGNGNSAGGSFAEWEGDHPFTNFLHLYHHLTQRMGYFVDFVAVPQMMSLVTASSGSVVSPLSAYAVLLITDPEDYLDPGAVSAIADAVQNHGLHVLLFTEWAHAKVMQFVTFTDAASKVRWVPVTGGTHVAAVNELLSRFQLSQSTDCVVSGPIISGDGTLWGHLRSAGCLTASVYEPARASSSSSSLSSSTCLCRAIGGDGKHALYDDAAEMEAASVRLPGGRRLQPAAARRPIPRDVQPYSMALMFAKPSGPSLHRGGVFALADSDCIDSTLHFGQGGQLTDHQFCFTLMEEALKQLKQGHLTGTLETNCDCNQQRLAATDSIRLSADSDVFRNVSRRYRVAETGKRLNSEPHSGTEQRFAIENFMTALLERWTSTYRVALLEQASVESHSEAEDSTTTKGNTPGGGILKKALIVWMVIVACAMGYVALQCHRRGRRGQRRHWLKV